MTFDARERSDDLGRPVELYTFSRGYLTWLYTSADAERVVDFQTYKRAPIQRTNIEQGTEINRSALNLTVPRDFEIAMMYAARPPSDTIGLIMRQYHEGDGEIQTKWTGRVISVGFEGATAKIRCEPSGTAVRRNGLRRPWQRHCPRVLYSSGCGVNPVAFRLQAPVDSVSGVTITANELSSQPDGYWEGGYVEWPIVTGIYERRFIVSHSAATVTVESVPVSMPAGIVASFFPGCDHTIGTGGCGRFGNELRFGGMPYIPKKNPFGNDPVY